MTVEVVSLIPGHICERDSLVEVCRTAARANGFRAPLAIMEGRTDSTILQNEGGIASVIFGPGTCGMAHTSREALVLPPFYRGAQACLDAVAALAGGTGEG
jgi:acetylornithine deacetylase/succinyl-diaminopimelate desuccinylase-like protein